MDYEPETFVEPDMLLVDEWIATTRVLLDKV